MSTPTSLTHDNASSSSAVEHDSHEWHPPQAGDSRSPCPALNTLANHGFLPRDGKQLTGPILTHGLEQGYSLSSALAHVLANGGVALLGQFGAFDLNDLARHNRIEHNASLAHDDAKPRDEYAPIAPNSKLITQFLEQAKDGRLMTVEDVARARVWRESQCPGLNAFQAEIARGEMAIALGIFGQRNSDKEGIPVDFLRTWLSEERLPDGWKPTHTQGLPETIRTSRKLFNEMKRIEKDGENTAPGRQRVMVDAMLFMFVLALCVGYFFIGSSKFV
ncbi:Cloroperoxidase [Russula earlei]|uniref:Cloroperoxidase n=1 Tax=Russula earlei TaxID=71964 RepID=A0ACC0TXW7_9AGAM|nr:Cloroperoxidase [Russula earlei]